MYVYIYVYEFKRCTRIAVLFTVANSVRPITVNQTGAYKKKRSKSCYDLNWQKRQSLKTKYYNFMRIGLHKTMEKQFVLRTFAIYVLMVKRGKRQ